MFWYLLLYVYLYCVSVNIIPHNFHNFTLYFLHFNYEMNVTVKKYVSYLNTVAHTKLYTARNCQNKLTIYVRGLLNTKPEYSSCKNWKCTYACICCGPGWPQTVMWYTHMYICTCTHTRTHTRTHTHTHTHTHSNFTLHWYIVCDSPPQAGHKTSQPVALLNLCVPRFNTWQSTVPDAQFCTLAQGWWFSIMVLLWTPSLCANLTRCHCKKGMSKC
jgi:hypothetical protein